MTLPLDVVALSLRRKAQEAVLRMHFLARLGLVALLAVVGLALRWAVILASEVLLYVGGDLVEGVMKFAEKPPAAV